MKQRIFHPQVNHGVPEITAEDLHTALARPDADRVRLIDVRRPEEFNNELGHIPGSVLATLGPDLTELLEKGDRSEEVVFICRSGARSATATLESQRLGYHLTVNLIGGMLGWNDKKFPTARD